MRYNQAAENLVKLKEMDQYYAMWIEKIENQFNIKFAQILITCVVQQFVKMSKEVATASVPVLDFLFQLIANDLNMIHYNLDGFLRINSTDNLLNGLQTLDSLDAEHCAPFCEKMGSTMDELRLSSIQNDIANGSTE